jgi:hypothetical protein
VYIQENLILILQLGTGLFNFSFELHNNNIGITFEFQDFEGKYAAFSQNLMMSILFVALLVKRGNLLI